MTLPLYNVAPDPGGADDTAALQAAINGTPDMGCLLFPPSAVYHVSVPLSLYNRTGLTLASLGGTDLASLGLGGAEFVWVGSVTPPPVAVFDVNHSRHVTLRNLTVRLDQNATPPLAAVSVDQYSDPAKPAPVTNTTRCLLEGLTLVMPRQAGTVAGVSISRLSKSNVEFTTCQRVLVQSGNNTPGWGDGFVVGASYNAKVNRFRDCEVSYATNGFRFLQGGGLIECATGTGNACDVRLDGLSDPLTVRGCRFESSGIAASSVVLQDAALILEANDWASVTGPYCLDLPVRQLFLRGNKFQGAPPVGAAKTIAFFPRVTDSRVIAEGNLFAKVTVNPFDAYAIDCGLNWQRSY